MTVVILTSEFEIPKCLHFLGGGWEGVKANCKYLSDYKYKVASQRIQKEQVYDILELLRKSITECNMKFLETCINTNVHGMRHGIKNP